MVGEFARVSWKKAGGVGVDKDVARAFTSLQAELCLACGQLQHQAKRIREDRRAGLESFLPRLEGATFHAKLGTQAQRVARITRLAEHLAPLVGADPALAERAARLCKADLASGMVGEFPELQGVMGRYYALHDGEDTVGGETVWVG